MLFLVSCAYAAFVAPADTASPSSREFTEEEFRKYTPHYESVVALIIPDDNVELPAFWADVSVVFAGSSDFCLFRAAHFPRLRNIFSGKLPGLCFFFRGRLMITCPLPDNESDMMALISSWVDRMRVIVGSLDSLHKYIDAVPLSLICRDTSGSRGMGILTTVLPVTAAVAVVRANGTVFEELGFGEDVDMALFRREDRTVVSVEESPSSVMQAAFPFVAPITQRALDMNGYCMALFDETFDEEKHAPLYKLAEEFYTDFRFGVVPKGHLKIAERMNISVKKFPSLVAFSMSAGVVIPTDTMEGVDPSDPAWLELAREYVYDIRNGTLTPHFLSEEPTEGGVVKKIVGTTFGEFVTDKQHDVVVMFHNDDDVENNEALHQLEAVATELEKAGMTSFTFGRINFQKNSCPIRYPFMITSPMIQIFPAKNKSGSIPLFATPQRSNVLRFLKQHSTLDHKIQVADMTPIEAATERVAFGMKVNMEKLPSPLYSQAADFVKGLVEIESTMGDPTELGNDRDVNL